MNFSDESHHESVRVILSQNQRVQANRPIPSAPGPTLAIEYLALAFVFLAAIAAALSKIGMTDTPWHLATARMAFQTGFPGTWIATNTFSYAYPEHALSQQYPIYQSLLYGVYRFLGFEGLSLLNCAGWVGALLLWIRWGGGLQWAARLHPVWALVMYGLQRRMILRPDMLTMPLFVALLLFIDTYRTKERSQKWAAAGMVFIQFLMANTHQLFILGIAVQVLFLSHLLTVRAAGGRFGLSTADRGVPLGPMVFALTGSLMSCLATPLGLQILRVPLITADSLMSHRWIVSEFAPLTGMPYPLALVGIGAVLAAAGFLLVKRAWQPYELGIWLMGTALAAAANRGTAFSVAISGAVFARCFARYLSAKEESQPTPQPDRLSGRLGSRRIITLTMTFSACLIMMNYRWLHPSYGMESVVQPGIGRSLGQWPDASIDFLKNDLPPGNMINLSWYSGNILIWELYPRAKVFVDPRFESYPREFLVKVIAAEESDDLLGELIATYDPTWMVGEVRLESVQKRAAHLLATREWQLVFVDPVFFVLVRATPETREYLERHAREVEQNEPVGFVTGPPNLLEEQLRRVAGFYRTIGRPEKADELLGRVSARSRYQDR